MKLPFSESVLTSLARVDPYATGSAQRKEKATPRTQGRRITMNTLNEGIWTLWNKARETLTDDELLALTEGSSLADYQAKHAATVCDNLGALISNDEANGTMEDGKSVAAMVWVLGNQFDMIASLYDIADRAREELHERLGMGIDLLSARKKARNEQGAPPQG